MSAPNGLVASSLILSLALWVSACARAVPDVSPSTQAALTVVSWNMNAGRGDLPRLLGDLVSGRLTGSPVRDYALLLQEVALSNERSLAVTPALFVFFSPVRRTAERTSGNAIVATRPLVDPRSIELPRERQPRGAAIAAVDIAGERLFLASVHLENRVSWWRGGLFSEGARARQAAALIDAVPPRGHGVVGGDMNTWLGPTEPAWRALVDRFPDTPPGPPPTFRDRLVLDHVFFDLPDGWTVRRWVVPDRYGSDHHPVLGLISEPSPITRSWLRRPARTRSAAARS